MAHGGGSAEYLPVAQSSVSLFDLELGHAPISITTTPTNHETVRFNQATP